MYLKIYKYEDEILPFKLFSFCYCYACITISINSIFLFNILYITCTSYMKQNTDEFITKNIHLLKF